MGFFFESAESERKKRELEEENKRIEEEKIRKETIILNCNKKLHTF